jgi:hypothetical protein
MAVSIDLWGKGAGEMKRAALLIMSLALLIGLGAVVVAKMPGNTRPPADCQSRLWEYVAYLNDSFPETTTVQAVAQARKPWKFSSAMSGATFGAGVVFQTDSSAYSSTAQDGLTPLPFPPEQLWCVRLRQGHGSSTASEEQALYAVVFAGLHMNMYNAEWVLHEGPRDLPEPELEEILATIGCDLALD